VLRAQTGRYFVILIFLTVISVPTDALQHFAGITTNVLSLTTLATDRLYQFRVTLSNCIYIPEILGCMPKIRACLLAVYCFLSVRNKGRVTYK
jgi:hypothetical protein